MSWYGHDEHEGDAPVTTHRGVKVFVTQKGSFEARIGDARKYTGRKSMSALLKLIDDAQPEALVETVRPGSYINSAYADVKLSAARNGKLYDHPNKLVGSRYSERFYVATPELKAELERIHKAQRELGEAKRRLLEKAQEVTASNFAEIQTRLLKEREGEGGETPEVFEPES